ncbi:MAG: hypothetical protein R3F37_08860 [Candidatus Competibacteraceae bacterium]
MAAALEVSSFIPSARRARVELHASALTVSLGRENIFRAYHRLDPVPGAGLPYAHVI